MDDLIERYYEVVYRDPKRRIAKYEADIPAEMIVKELPYNQIEWRLLPWSSTIAAEFRSPEQEIWFKLPEIYKLWFCRYYRLSSIASAEVVRLIEAPPAKPFDPLRYHWKQAWGGKLLKAGLITIGDNGLSDEVCFDVSCPRDDGDYPIVTWFHEEGLGDETRDGIQATIFSSFQKLLECCVHYFSGDEDNWEDREKRAEGFFQIDPEGAGGKDRWYWELHIQG